MTVVRVNAISVPEGSGDTLALRFAQRAGAVDDADGFEGFELLRPTDGRDTWLVVTRWRDAEAFGAWVSSSAFAHGHRGVGHQGGGPGDGHARTGSGPGDAAEPPPVAMHAELWSYDVVDLGAVPDERGR